MAWAPSCIRFTANRNPTNSVASCTVRRRLDGRRLVGQRRALQAPSLKGFKISTSLGSLIMSNPWDQRGKPVFYFQHRKTKNSLNLLYSPSKTFLYSFSECFYCWILHFQLVRVSSLCLITPSYWLVEYSSGILNFCIWGRWGKIWFRI